MTGLWSQIRATDPVVRLLCVNQFGINVGFYMLMPYLAAYLTGDLGLAAGVAGLLLGVRNLSQQGMFFLGGTMADRIGYRPMIIAGCALRTVGFALLAVTGSLPGLIVGMAATGLAGALFNPAVRAYLAHRSGDRRVESFAVFNVFYQTGILAGPIIGLILVAVADFRLACAVAAGIFAVLTLLQLRALPPHRPERQLSESVEPVWRTWRTVFSNRPFLLFGLAMIGSYVLNFQVYLALPLLLQENAASVAAVSTTALFAVSGIATLVGQVRITQWCKEHLDRRQSLVGGMCLLAAAFLPPAVVLWLAAVPAAVVTAAVLSALLLSLGTMVVYPFEMDAIVDLAGERNVGTYYGLYNTMAGLGITAGNLAVGAALDVTVGAPALTWIGLAGVGLCCAVALRAVGPAPTSTAPEKELAQARA
jgi:MFS family permease